MVRVLHDTPNSKVTPRRVKFYSIFGWAGFILVYKGGGGGPQINECDIDADCPEILEGAFYYIKCIDHKCEWIVKQIG
ncbi:hypothetical protein P8452_48153 [Trifolium repens]|nr:hypothetical protein P8452_48153 [Trifolium repens]